MLKSLLAVVAVAVLVTVAMPALAGALFSAFGGTGSLAAAGAMNAAAIGAKVAAGIIIATAAGLASKLLLGSAKSLNGGSVSRLEISIDPTAPRKIVFGTTAAGADERYHELTNKAGNYIEESSEGDDAKGDYQHRVIALASHKLHAVRSVWLNDVLCYNNGTATGKYTEKAGLKITAITEGSSANAAPFASGNFWTTACKFTGCAYLRISQKLDADVYPDGLPTRLTTVVDGCPVYDPRQDSTNGGSGGHRWNDQNTWSFVSASDEIGRNPALCLLTYLIGYRINGKLAWGMGIPAARIDLGNFIAYANMADEIVSAGSITVKRYQADCLLSTADSHETNINILTAAMGSAKMIDAGGVYQLVGGYNDLDGPVFVMTLDDILQGYEWNPSAASIQNRYNVARGRFANPNKLYVLEDWGRLEIAPLADDIPRTLTMEFASVTRPESCQRIAKQALVRNAYTGTFSAVFGPRAFAVQVGSLVRLIIPHRGWDQPGTLFRVISQAESTDLIFQMTLQEEDEAIYAWDEDESVPLPPDVRPPAYDPNKTVPVQQLAANARSILNSYGETTSQIDVSWLTPDAAVSGIQIECREQNGSKWQTLTDRFEEGAGEFTFTAMAGGVTHEVRARYIMFSGIYGPWSTVEITSLESNRNTGVVGYLTDERAVFVANSSGAIL